MCSGSLEQGTAGVVTEYEIPTGSKTAILAYPGDTSFAITSGPDGNLWFTEAEANKIGKITPLGVITEYTLPDRDLPPRSIINGPDGNLWFVGSGAQESKLMAMKTDGTLENEYTVSGSDVGMALTAGPDGNFWFGGGASYSLTRATPEGTMTPFTTSGRPVVVIPGTENDLWFTQNGGLLSRITTAGAITEYQTPIGLAWVLAMSKDLMVWYKDSLEKKILKLDPANEVVSVYQLSDAANYTVASDMIFGPDDNIWFTSNGSIGKISLTITSSPTVTPSTTPTSTVVPTVIPTSVPTHTPTPKVMPSPTVKRIPTFKPVPRQEIDHEKILESMKKHFKELERILHLPKAWKSDR